VPVASSLPARRDPATAPDPCATSLRLPRGWRSPPYPADAHPDQLPRWLGHSSTSSRRVLSHRWPARVWLASRLLIRRTATSPPSTSPYACAYTGRTPRPFHTRQTTVARGHPSHDRST